MNTQAQALIDLGFKPGFVGTIMRNMVRTAIRIIRTESQAPTFENKMSYAGILDDFVGKADKLGQIIYEDGIEQYFPDFGAIGEENGLRKLCKIKDHDIYFTVDPLDGTKAFKRMQSHGVGTMIALVVDGAVVAAFIGDINTGEIFGFDATVDEPGTVHRHRFDFVQNVAPNTALALSDQYVYTRRHPANEPGWIQRLIMPKKQGGFFKDLEAGGGSIGTAIARLWKGELGAAILEPGFETPWDETPVVGICHWLGFEFYRIEREPTDGKLPIELVAKPLIKEVGKTHHGELIIHKDHAPELMAWIDGNGAALFAK